MTLSIDCTLLATSRTSSIFAVWMATGRVARGAHLITVRAFVDAGRVATTSVRVIRSVQPRLEAGPACQRRLNLDPLAAAEN